MTRRLYGRILAENGYFEKAIKVLTMGYTKRLFIFTWSGNRNARSCKPRKSILLIFNFEILAAILSH